MVILEKVETYKKKFSFCIQNTGIWQIDVAEELIHQQVQLPEWDEIKFDTNVFKPSLL